jgi:hypothetical protein
VNGYRVARAPADRIWKTFETIIAGDYVVDGTNEIIITWPEDENAFQVQLAGAADALGARRLPFFYRVYGEIHAVSVFDPSGVCVMKPISEQVYSR